MSGIFNGTIRFMNERARIAAIEIEANGVYSVIDVHDGAIDVGDEIVGNLTHAGDVDLFNRTRHDRVNGTIRHASVSREDAIRALQSNVA